MVLIWYKQGAYAFELGAIYEPPDNVLLRRAYAEGWADEIQGRYPSDEEIIRTLTVDV